MSRLRVATLVGSLREGLSSKLADALVTLAPVPLELHRIPIGGLGLYDQDADARPPESWTRFRSEIRASDAVLFVTPEYNRSIPGVLKNAIDVGSRPYGQNAFDGRPAAVISQSPGSLGGFGANHALRQSLVFLNMPTLQQPEAYLAHADRLFDADGGLRDPDTARFLRDFLEAFTRWIDRVSPRAAEDL